MSKATFRVVCGSAHALDVPDGSVQCIVTSPPYWRKRVYAGDQGVDWPEVVYRLNEWVDPVVVPAGVVALGEELDPVSYVGHLVLCLREWRRVLRADGVVFVVLGDGYVSGSGVGGGGGGGSVRPKNLCLVPEMFALAVRADGWYVRSRIAWVKPSPMPESVLDRPTGAWEHVWMLSRSARYYWDAEAVREGAVYEGDTRHLRADASKERGGPREDGGSRRRTGRPTSGRNLRNWWVVSTQPMPFAHFATYPERIPELAILAATSERGCCVVCGAPVVRVVDRVANSSNAREAARQRERNAGVSSGGMDGVTLGVTDRVKRTTLGWRGGCDCGSGIGGGVDRSVPCVVLDPFHGSGTTGVVALRLGRSYIGVDTNEGYLGGITRERFGMAARKHPGSRSLRDWGSDTGVYEEELG